MEYGIPEDSIYKDNSKFLDLILGGQINALLKRLKPSNIKLRLVKTFEDLLNCLPLI